MTESLPYASPPPVARRDAAFALLAGFLGWTLDAFDFFLVVMCLPNIGHDFGRSDVEMAWAITVTMAFRPVGAFIFGLLADRYGRRLPMIADLIFYSLVEVATGLTHHFSTFLICRALFGIGMGGEWGVGASLVIEKVPPKFRGIISGLLQEGYAAGYLLAAVAYGLVFPRFGWRPLFFIGGLPALLALFVRFGITESAIWERSKPPSWSQLGSTLISHWKLWLYLTVLMAMLNFSSHGTQDLYPTFLARYHHATATQKSTITVIMNCGAIGGGVIFGLLSDRIGRRRSMCIAFAGALLLAPVWAFAPSLPLLAITAFAMQLMVQGAWGVIPAHINELSPNALRGFLPGFAYQCGAVIAGSAPTIQAKVASKIGYPMAMAIISSIIFVLAFIVTFAGPERHAQPFETIEQPPDLQPRPQELQTHRS